MKNRIAVNTWSLQRLSVVQGKSLDEVLQLIAGMGVTAVQTSVDYLLLPTYDNLHGYRQLRKRAEAMNLELYCLLVKLDMVGAVRLSSLDTVVGQLKASLAVASELGARMLVMPPGDAWAGVDLDEGHRTFVDVFSRVIPAAQKYGVRMGLEVGRAAGRFKSPQYALKLVRAIDSEYLTVVPDFEAWRIPTEDLRLGHAERPGELQVDPCPLQVFRDCLTCAPYIHAKLLRFNADGEEPHFPIAELTDAINRSPMEHVVCLEYEGWIPDIDPHLDPLVETKRGLALLRRYLL